MNSIQTKRVPRIGTILVPLDFSRASMSALKYAIPMAEEFDSTIHLVHVRPVDELSAIPGVEHLILNAVDALALMQDRLAEVQERHEVRFLPEHCHIISGRPDREVCELAREINASLIILPTRGHSGLKRIALGSTAERIIRHASCPVLIPRGPKFRSTTWSGSPAEKFTLRKILVPVDFSQCSMAGLKYAASLAKRFKAKLQLLHVVFPYAKAFQFDRAATDLAPLIETAQSQAEKRMRTIQRLKWMNGIRNETEIRVGSVIEEICEATKQPGLDLMVTSTHGRTGWQRAMLGSVAEHVIRYAECPVLVIPNEMPQIG